MKRLFCIIAVISAVACAKDETIMYNDVVMGEVKSGEFITDYGLTYDVVENEADFDLSQDRRILAICDILSKKSDGVYNVRLEKALVPLVKESIRSDEIEDESAVGNDPINITNGWVSGGYLNLQVLFTYLKTSSVKHQVNLVLDSSASSDTLRFTLRHNAHNEVPGKQESGLAYNSQYVCFPVTSLVPSGKDSLPYSVTWCWYEDVKDTSSVKIFHATGTVKK